MFTEWRLPVPTNVSARLGELRSSGDVISEGRRNPRWSLTPVGHKRVREIIGAIDASRLEPQLAHIPGAQFGTARHTILPPALAPHRWMEGINKLLARSPLDTNVLCMTRFSREDKPGRSDAGGDRSWRGGHVLWSGTGPPRRCRAI